MAASDLEADLSSRLAAAERLLASGTMVGGADDHRLWRSSRDLWAAKTVEALAGKTGEDGMRAFQRAITPPAGEGNLSEDLPIELEAVRHGMAVLVGMRAQIQRQLPEAPTKTDRRDRRLGP